MSNHTQSKSASPPRPSRHRRKNKGHSDSAKEAQAYLQSPDLLNRCVRDIQLGFGIADEAHLLSLAYLAITSRRLPQPISLIVRGEAGSGKTYALDSVCALVPPEELVEATHLSPKALYYLGDELAGKVLYGKERSRLTGPEAQEVTRALRQLISDGKIRNLTVSSDRAGQTLEVRGPVTYLETTTLRQDEIFSEDLSRLLLINTTTSEEHRREIYRAIGARYGDDHETRGELRERVIHRHQLIQGELLKPANIQIPFQRVLADAFPTFGTSRVRLVERAFVAIAAVAYLHQYQRDRSPNGAILATPADYETVRPMLNLLLSSSLCQGQGWSG